MRISAIFFWLVAGATATASCAAAQEITDNGRGEISLGASYSTQYGAIAVVGFEGANIGGSGIDAALNYRAGDTGQGGSARLRYSRDLQTSRLGRNAAFFVSGQVSLSDWTTEAYKNRAQELSFGVTADLSQTLSYSTRIFGKQDDLSGLGAGSSPLVTAALGKSTSAGMELVAHIGKVQGGVLPISGAQLDFGVTWAGAGDRKTTALFAATTLAHPIGTKNSAVFRAETGQITGLNGQNVGIQDRAFLGGSGGPRGFAFGSIGPRDLVAGSIDTPLGGTRYLSISTEIRRDLNDRLSLGVFADAGAVWDLGNEPTIGASGAIDDGRYMRSSGGVAVYLDTALGKVNLSLAQPIDARPNDNFNELSISLLRSF